MGKNASYPGGVKGILFSDLDGTILDNAHNLIPESTLKAIRLLRENGYLFVLSTGRDMDTHYSVEYVEPLKPDAIIHSNGSKITIDGKLIFRHYMDDGLVRRIYAFCKERGYCVGTSIGKEDFFLNPKVKYDTERAYKKVVRRNFVPFEEIFRRGIKVSTMSFAGNLEEQKPIVEAAIPEIELFTFAGSAGADLIEKGYTKAAGFRRICGHYGVDAADTVAIGDSHNDVPILEAAGIGIAMGNADEIAREAADYVTDTIFNDGFYKAMVHVGLINEEEG